MELGLVMSAVLIAVGTNVIEVKYSKRSRWALSICGTASILYSNILKYFGIDSSVNLICVLILAAGAVANMAVYHQRRNASVRNGDSDEEIIKSFDINNERYLVIYKIIWIVNFIHLISLIYEGNNKLRNIFIIVTILASIVQQLISKENYFYGLVAIDVAVIIYIICFLAPSGQFAHLAYSIQLVLAHIPFFCSDKTNNKINNKLFNFNKRKK